ncbi:MAG: helix-turn-helix domain-containing protein [Abditibacteriota bacterium]|nr:helix-turn-helix domain-containing protein [Abditibacteriota bacterium]
MTDIGEILREKREARGLSAEEAEAETKLAAGSIRAVEDNRFDGFRNKVYARAFVRDYANYLAVDPKPLLDRLDEIYAPPAEAAEEPEEDAPEEIPALPEKNAPGLDRVVISFAVFLLLALICYGVSRYNRPSSPAPAPEPAVSLQTEPGPPSVPEAPAQPETAKKYAEGVTVSVKTFAWYPATHLRIVVDGVVKYNQSTGPAACLEYTGKTYVKIYTDNSDHIQIRVNGRLEDSMGAPGKPVTKYYQVNTPETRPAE